MHRFEDGPPGDEDYSGARGEAGGARRRFPPLLAGWAPADSHSWFALAESSFHRSGIADSRLCFDLVLPALPEEVIEQLRSILHTVNDIADPQDEAAELLHPQAAGPLPEDHQRQ